MNAPDFDPDFAGPGQWAVFYRSIRLQIVPCKDKRPDLHTWVGLRDELAPDFTFARWYGPGGEHVSNGNMGIITGPCSGGVFVVDLDTHKHPEADRWWRELVEAENSGIDPETVQQRTGGGGVQKLFRAPPGWRSPTCRTSIGVDIRGTAGFAVMPPTRHASGTNYAWMPGCAPWEIEIETAPQWLLDAIDMLVEAHGGSSENASRETSASPGADYTAFGQRQDGREEYMAQVVWAAVVDARREAPMRPVGAPEEALLMASYEAYERNVTTRLPGDDKRAGLEREGRGLTAFRGKWRAAMRHWDGKVAEAAKEPNPRGSNSDHFGPRPDGASEPPKEEAKASAKLVPLQSAFPIDEATIAPRDWIVPGLLLKRSMSMLVAPPASGKSLLTLQLGVAVALGMEWGGWVPRRPEKVLIVNAEDDIEEMRRRLVAVARQMGVTQADLTDRLFLAEAPESIVIAKVDNRTKTVVRTPLVEDLVATIKHHGIGLVVADPFAETFEGDENSNSEVKWAGVLWREVARRTSSSLLLVHHTKKYAGGMAGDADASRGGGAMIGIARIVGTFFNMTEEEAAAMGVDVERRSDYVRFDDGKANYSRRGSVRWFEKQTLTLSNGTGFVPGDEVGVLVPWKPAGPTDGITMAILTMCWDRIDRGLEDAAGRPTGAFYSPAPHAKDRWVGHVVMDELGRNEEGTKSILKYWEKERVIETFDYVDPAQRKQRKGVRCIAANRPDRGMI